MSDFEYERRLWPRIKSAFRILIAFTFSHVGVCVLVVGYIICGAFLFQKIESQALDPKLEDVRKLRVETANRLLHIVIKFNTIEKDEFFRLANAELKNYSMEIVSAYHEGFDGEPEKNMYGNETIPEGNLHWTIPSSFLYSLTVITTIGYGNLTPRSPWGKVTTIIYGIIGMPLFLLYLSNIGDIFARGFKWTFARCCQCKWNCVRRRQRYMDEDGEEVEEEEQITVPISVCLALMVGYVCGGGLLFSKWEKWKFLDASYFCFISLSTIGFGDLVPGDAIPGPDAKDLKDVMQLSFIFCSMYLLLGMALIAMCFNLMQEEVIAKVRSCGRRLGCSRR